MTIEKVFEESLVTNYPCRHIANVTRMQRMQKMTSQFHQNVKIHGHQYLCKSNIHVYFVPIRLVFWG